MIDGIGSPGTVHTGGGVHCLVSRIVLLLVVTLSACIGPQLAAEHDPAQVIAGDGEGLLWARVSTTVASARLNPIQAVLEVQLLDGGAVRDFLFGSYLVPCRSAGSAYSLVFLGSLPPGEYQIRTFISGTTQLVSAPFGDRLPSFAIEAGKITDYGAIVLDFESLYTSGTRGSFAFFHVAQEDLEPSFLEATDSQAIAAFRTRASDVAAGPPHGGAPPVAQQRLPTALRARLEVARQASDVTARSRPESVSPGVLGTTLGQVRIWNSRARALERLDTSRMAAVTSVLARGEGLLIGFDDGVLMQRESGESGAWRRLPSPLPAGAILLLAEVSRDRVLAVLERSGFCVVMESESLEQGAWRELGRFSLFADGLGEMTLRPGVGAAGGRLVLTIPRPGAWFYGLDAHELDLDSGAWTVSPIEGGLPTLHVLESGVLLSVVGADGLRVSEDGGRSWRSVPCPERTRLVAFRDRDTLYAKVPDQFSAITGDSGDYSLWTSFDGGGTWTRGQSLPAFLKTLQVLPDGGALLVSDLIGALYLSTDGGRSWRVQ